MEPAIDAAPSQIWWKRHSAWVITLGILVLAIPSYFLFDLMHGPFWKQCKEHCRAQNMDYRVRAVRRNDPTEYHGECVCVPKS